MFFGAFHSILHGETKHRRAKLMTQKCLSSGQLPKAPNIVQLRILRQSCIFGIILIRKFSILWMGHVFQNLKIIMKMISFWVIGKDISKGINSWIMRKPPRAAISWSRSMLNVKLFRKHFCSSTHSLKPIDGLFANGTINWQISWCLIRRLISITAALCIENEK